MPLNSLGCESCDCKTSKSAQKGASRRLQGLIARISVSNQPSSNRNLESSGFEVRSEQKDGNGVQILAAAHHRDIIILGRASLSVSNKTN